jgi:hypothetical protein
VRVPVGIRVDTLTDRIMKLGPAATQRVEWDEKKRPLGGYPRLSFAKTTVRRCSGLSRLFRELVA